MTNTSSIVHQPPYSSKISVMPYISLPELRSSKEPSWSSFSYPRHYKPQEKLCRCVSDVSPKSPPLTQLYLHIEKPVDPPPAPAAPLCCGGQQDTVGNDRVWSPKLRSRTWPWHLLLVWFGASHLTLTNFPRLGFLICSRVVSTSLSLPRMGCFINICMDVSCYPCS